MNDRWSDQLARRYRIRMTPDLVDWFDNGWWEKQGGREFHRPLAPATLLDPPPGLIWTGMLPADMLPLVSNDYGDLICLRAGEGEAIREMAIWRHGGGDWIPCGATLAEALLYDAVIGGPYSHQERFHNREQVDPEERYTFARWAAEHVDCGDRPWPQDWNDASWPAQMQSARCARECLSRDVCLKALHTPLRERRSLDAARTLDLPWSPEFVSWQFDAQRAPAEVLRRIADRLAVVPESIGSQDWEAAADEARRVTAYRSDLAWPWDILGWNAERRGDTKAAVAAYRSGIHASRFTDQSIDFRTHWFDEACGKFAAWRLRELMEHLPAETLADPYLQILVAADEEKLRERIGDYWMAAAEKATRDGDHRLAYDCYLRAGWDIGLATRGGYEHVLRSLIDAAEAAGDEARSAVARVHLEAL